MSGYPNYDPYRQTTTSSRPGLYVTSGEARRDRFTKAEPGPRLPPINYEYPQVIPFNTPAPDLDHEQHARAVSRDREGQDNPYSHPPPTPSTSPFARSMGRDRYAPTTENDGLSSPVAYIGPYMRTTRSAQRRGYGESPVYPQDQLPPPKHYRTYSQLQMDNAPPNPSDRSPNYFVRAPSNEPPSDYYERTWRPDPPVDGFVQETPGQLPEYANQRHDHWRRPNRPSGALQWVEENPEEAWRNGNRHRRNRISM